MWEGYEYTLCCYGIKMCQEWRRRGYKDTMLPRFMEALMEFQAVGMGYEEPAWFSNECLFASHRANLLRKDTNYYSRFGWVVNKHMPYYWPRQIKYLTK
jgi:hypothetical protein